MNDLETSSSALTLQVSADDQGHRLDRWLSTKLTEHSRSEIQRWIKTGVVLVDGQTAKTSTKVEAGQLVEIETPQPATEATLLAEDLPLTILFQDQNTVVVDKPAGMVVHPAAGHPSGTLVNGVLYHCPDIEGVGGERRPGLVHRLDKETSGVIVLAKNDLAHQFLQNQFQERYVYKEYLALVEGDVTPVKGRINAPIGRHPVHRKRQAILPNDPVTGISAGREAITDYEVIGQYQKVLPSSAGVAYFNLIKVILHTGRTHQIRVHMAWHKHPIVGDTVYGYRKQRIKLDRHFLHAHRLKIQLLGEDKPREFVSPLGEELEKVLASLEQE